MSSGVRVNRSLVIPLAEIEVRADPSGGPGGQHANRSSTRVEVRFDVERSTVLGPRQRARLLDRLGPVVRAVAGESRSQMRNREVALERLGAKVAAGLVVERARVASKPTRAAKERRLQDKKQRGEVKRGRGRSSGRDAGRDGWS